MKTQFHTLPKAVRADRRKQAFKLLDTGRNKYEVAVFTEVHPKTIEVWIRKRAPLEKNKYQGSKRGNPQEQKHLKAKEEKEILTAIKSSSPDKEGVHAFLWSRKAIGELIYHKYGRTLSPQLISLYTKRWGLSAQRPKKQATEQDPEKIRVWLEETYPQIKKNAAQQGALILWGDETNLNINTNYQRTYAPKGKTPVLKIPARKTSYSMVSVLANQGTLRYMVYKGGMNAKLFKVFLTRLIKDSDQKIFLIVDNLKVHHAKLITAWQKQHRDEIELFFPTTILPTR